MYRYKLDTDNDGMSLEKQEKAKENKRFNVNKKLLPIKCHYFLDNGAASCVEPFVSLYGRKLGISATAVSIVLCVTPLLSIVSKPLMSGLTDYFQILKSALVSVTIFKALPYMIILFMPETSVHTLHANATLMCSDSWTLLLSQHAAPTWQCLANKPLSCAVQCSDCSYNSWPFATPHGFNVRHQEICQQNELKLSLSPLNRKRTKFTILSEHSSCFSGVTSTCALKCPCLSECCLYRNDLITPQFWLFLIMRLAVTLIGSMRYTLADTACYELLEDKIGHFGRQRLFASIGWGVFSFITGIFMDIFPSEQKTNFCIGVFIMISLTVIDFVVALRIPVKTSVPSGNILKDVRTSLASFEAVVFMIALTICGCLDAVNTNYLFWYMEDLGATNTLMTLTNLLYVLLAEAPVFIFSGVIIEKCGYFLCIVMVLLVFSIGHVCVSVIYNAWLAVPIALCDGITFSLFYATMTSYAKTSSKPGTETTMQGFIGGLYMGLGASIGTLLTGYSFDKLGARMTFRLSGTFAGVAGIVMFIIYQKLESRKHMKSEKAELEL